MFWNKPYKFVSKITSDGATDAYMRGVSHGVEWVNTFNTLYPTHGCSFMGEEFENGYFDAVAEARRHLKKYNSTPEEIVAGAWCITSFSR